MLRILFSSYIFLIYTPQDIIHECKSLFVSESCVCLHLSCNRSHTTNPNPPEVQGPNLVLESPWEGESREGAELFSSAYLVVLMASTLEQLCEGSVVASKS